MRLLLLGLGPVLFVVLFAVRALMPVFDPILLGVAIAAAIISGFMLAGQRWAAVAYLIFPIAVLTSPATEEFAFNLSAVDSSAWRIHTLAALLGLGWGIGSAAIVFFDITSPARTAAGLLGGLAAGVALVAGVQTVAPQPGFGGDLSDEELAALPVVELVNYAFRPAAIGVEAGSPFVARLDNPSDLPHSYTIEELGIDVYVPARRWAVVEIRAEQLASGDLAVICDIGDHRERGMRGVVRSA
jgi:hypothetical protein